jgi:hypothetical protein
LQGIQLGSEFSTSSFSNSTCGVAASEARTGKMAMAIKLRHWTIYLIRIKDGLLGAVEARRKSRHYRFRKTDLLRSGTDKITVSV